MDELSGYSAEDIMGESFVKIALGEEGKDTVAYVLLNALSGEEAADIPFPLLYRHEDGTQTQKDMLMNVTPRRGPDGDITGVIVVVHHVTEVQHLVAEQRGIAEDLAILIRTVRALIIGVDATGSVNEWNDKTEELTGYTRAEAMGRPFVEKFVDPERQAEISEA
ncbi:unnamed protein product, partial [Prorocentrum cordatum]